MWQRIRRLFAAMFGRAADAMEGPEMLDQVVREMRDAERDGKAKVAAAIADEKGLEAKFRKAEREAHQWREKAKFAVREGQDDLAKEALLRERQHKQVADTFNAQWAKARTDVGVLQLSLKQLSAKITEAENKRSILQARARMADFRKYVEETRVGLQDNSAFAAFARIEEKVERKEAEAEAMATMAESETGANLDTRFEELATEAAADVSLAALKAEMGLGAPALSEGTGVRVSEVIEGELIDEEEDDYAKVRTR